MVYEWFTLDGEPFSSSEGNVILVSDVLELLEPDVLRYFFAKDPAKARDFSIERLDQLVDEFDRLEATYFGEIDASEDEQAFADRVYPFVVEEPREERIRLPYTFAAVLGMTDDPDLREEIARREGHIPDDAPEWAVAGALERVEQARNWARRTGNEFDYELKRTEIPAHDFDAETEAALADLADFIEAGHDPEEIQGEIYEPRSATTSTPATSSRRATGCSSTRSRGRSSVRSSRRSIGRSSSDDCAGSGERTRTAGRIDKSHLRTPPGDSIDGHGSLAVVSPPAIYGSELLTWVLIGLLLYWIAVIGLRNGGYLPEYIGTQGPILTFHTKRGRVLLDRLARPKRFWRAWSNFGVGIALVVMISMFAVLIRVAVIALSSPQSASSPARQPHNVLVIPGVNDFLPLSATPGIVFGLLVGLVVHEGGHGLLCRVEDIDIDSMGVAMLAFLPIGAFVEPDQESSKSASRGGQTRMFAAGVTNNFAITLLAFASCSVPSSARSASLPEPPSAASPPIRPQPTPGSSRTTALPRSTAPQSRATTTSRPDSRPSTASRSPSNSTASGRSPSIDPCSCPPRWKTARRDSPSVTRSARSTAKPSRPNAASTTPSATASGSR